MGFGWLFIGYFTVHLLTLTPVGVFFRIAGYGIILMAFLKLRKYHRSFNASILTTCFMLCISVALLLADNRIFSNSWVSESMKTMIGYVEQGTSLFFHALLLYAIRKIALETEVQKISDSAIRNFVFICFYYIVYLVSLIPLPSIRNVIPELTMISWILYLSFMVLNLILFGKCYANICDEKDLDMTRRPSRFAWVNQMRAEFDRREQKAIDETAAYRKERMQKRFQKNQEYQRNKNKRKKR